MINGMMVVGKKDASYTLTMGNLDRWWYGYAADGIIGESFGALSPDKYKNSPILMLAYSVQEEKLWMAFNDKVATLKLTIHFDKYNITRTLIKDGTNFYVAAHYNDAILQIFCADNIGKTIKFQLYE